MTALLDLIKGRRSCRNFKPDPVPKPLIDQVIEAGLYAASGKGLQSQIIIAVTNRQLLDELNAINSAFGGGPDPFYGAPCVLIVAAETSNRSQAYDGALTLGNMMLMAHDLGLGSCWIHRARQEFESDFGRNLLKELGLKGNYEGVGHLALGYPAIPSSFVFPRRPNRVFYIE